MGTTIRPMIAGGPEDDEGPVGFPRDPSLTRLMEARRQPKTAKAIVKSAEAKNPKSFIKKAEGHSSKGKKRVKTSKKPENLRVKTAKSKKLGSFGEAYSPVSAGKKGERVSESR